MENGFVSKTRRKKEMHALQDLGLELVALNDERLASLDLPEQLRQAVQEARRLRGFEARRRQLQYIGRLMREVDPDPIRARFAAWDGTSRAHAIWLHDLERWRERLLADPDALFDLAAHYPGADLQHLRTLVRGARMEEQARKPRRHFRALLRALKTLMTEPDIDDGSHR